MMASRVVCWFSCGAASAVATKLALRKYAATHDVVIARTVIASEHEDNDRFAADCEAWFGRSIVNLRSEKYADTWEVWEKRRFLVGPRGALCTTELKKIPRFAFQRADDIQVFGYTADEVDRAARFREQNFEITLETPLIEAGLGKSDCLALIDRAGIKLPTMYLLGYENNNCIGCVKGGAGYWNKIRRDFPAVFDRMAKLERTLDATVTKLGDERVFLDRLPPDAGRYQDEPDISCSLLCHMADEDLKGANP